MNSLKARAPNSTTGFTLVELLIGMVVGLIVVGSAGNMVVNTVESRSNAAELRQEA